MVRIPSRSRAVYLVACTLGTGWGGVPSTARAAQASEGWVTTIPTSMPLPSQGRLGGVAADRAGNVFVSNFGSTVWRVAADGRVTALAENLRGSSGNTVDPKGNLLQASFLDGRIVRIAPDGSVTDVVTAGLAGPVGLTVTQDGTVFVCQCRGNSVARVSADGTVSEFATSPDFDCPNGITAAPDGNLYVVSFNNGHVVRVDRQGRSARFATVPDGRNAHLAYARGAFWVTKIEANVLYRLGRDGRAERFAGTGKLGFDDGPAADAPLARPNGIAATPDGAALVVNTLEGPWRGDEATRIVLRRITIPRADARIERIEIPVGDLQFDALAAGPVDGALVVLLHGFPQAGDAFRAELRALATAGYRAVAPDQRGYSPGARPADVGAYVMTNFVADVMGMADALGRRRFHLVGHDWGGAVAWAAATQHPDRIRTLTVLSTPHYSALRAALADTGTDQGTRSSYFADFAAPGAEHRLLAHDKAPLHAILDGLPSDAQATYLDKLGTPDALRAALAWYHVFTRPPAPAGTPSSGSVGTRTNPVTVPTLYVWGSRDGAFGRAAAERTRDFVAGPYEFHILEGVGHWIPELAADTVSRLLVRHLRGDQGRATGTLENYARAHDILERAARALGGRAAILESGGVAASYRADGVARGQSRRPGPPWDSTHASGRFVYAPDGRLYHEEAFVNAGGTDRSFRRALLDIGSWNLWVARRLLQPIDAADRSLLSRQAALNPAKALPHLVLRAALRDPAGVRFLGETPDEDVHEERIAFPEPDGQMVTLSIDAATGSPQSIERIGSDLLAGDASQGVRFLDYAVVDGVAIPHRIVFTLNGAPLREWSLSAVSVGAPRDSTVFTPPADLEPVTHPDRFAPREVAPGIHVARLYSGPANSYNTMLVEFADHVIVVEVPLVGAFVPVIRRVAARVAPGKPIRAVVTTHHHHDHAGGAVRFLAEGTDVIAPPDAAEVLRAAAAARHTVGASAPAAGTPGRLITVTDSLVLRDASRTLRLLQVGPTPHVDEILVAHLPGERVLFVADLLAIPESRVFPPASATFRHLAELLPRLGLEFETVVPAHGVVGTRADFTAAVRR